MKTKREELAKYLEVQAAGLKQIAAELRNGEDISDSIWLVDIWTTEEWNKELSAIEAQEVYNHELAVAIEMKESA